MSVVSALDSPCPPEGLCVMIIPKWDEGDTRIEWDPKQTDQVEAARKHFVDLKAKGYKAYRVDPKSSEKGELIKEFDPKIEKLVMIPAFAGG